MAKHYNTSGLDHIEEDAPQEAVEEALTPESAVDAASSETGESVESAKVNTGKTSFWFELFLLILGTLAIAVCIRLFVAETFQVPTGSMLETIQLGDLLVGEKVTLHWSSPKQGEIVTFNDPDGSGNTLIKRVIATEGQVVDLLDGYVVIDGEMLNEDYVLGKPSYALVGHASNLTEDVSYPYTVPEGCIWVMGDNRTVSLDSRYFGAIPVSSVTSKALFIYWPFSDAGKL